MFGQAPPGAIQPAIKYQAHTFGAPAPPPGSLNFSYRHTISLQGL